MLAGIVQVSIRFFSSLISLSRPSRSLFKHSKAKHYSSTTHINTMRNSHQEHSLSISGAVSSALLLLSLLPTTQAYTQNLYFARNANPKPRPAQRGPPMKRDSLPLKISNLCDTPIWPGIGTQAGTGAGTGGFKLDPQESKDLMVSADWQGRVWGRTNCSFNVAGNGPANPALGGASCDTGDCAGVLDCVMTVS